MSNALCALVCAAVLAAGSGGRTATGYDPPPDPLPTFVPALSSAPVASPTFTPLAPPQIPPRDAGAVAHTTPPLVSPSGRVAPPVGPADGWPRGYESQSIDIDVRGPLARVPVIVDGALLHLVVDCGAPTAVFALSRLGSGADSPPSPVSLQVGNVRFGEVPLSATAAGSGSIAGVPSAVRAYGDGVMGREICARYPLEIDYARRLLWLFRSEDALRATELSADQIGRGGMVVRQLSPTGGVASVSARLNGVPGRFALAMTSPSDVLISPAMAQAAAVRAPVWGIARARDLQVGPLDVAAPAVTVRAAVVAGQQVFGPGVDGALGGGLLSRFDVIIDLPDGLLALRAVRRVGVLR
ncbi:MAG: hypothetical protein M3T49_04325 [Candidatus Eremiobacteraeota bacterium]|nr:hypothetical protein [Candidatus Eremiobacteraeota bacterium]